MNLLEALDDGEIDEDGAVTSNLEGMLFTVFHPLSKGSTMDLCLHAGAHKVSLEEVREVSTPDGDRQWTPVPHETLLQSIVEELNGSGLEVVNESHALMRNGQRYFGLLEVINGDQHADYNTVVGIRNSHDKSFSVGLAVGSGVFVCDNLSFSGEVTIMRRHSRYVQRDLRGLIHRAVGGIGDLRKSQDQRIACYKRADMGDNSFHDLLVRAIDVGAIPVTKLKNVLHEWRTPIHDEFTEDGQTGWRGFNAFTEILKQFPNVSELAQRTQKLHGLFDTRCGVSDSLKLAT